MDLKNNNSQPRTNWSENILFTSTRRDYPSSVSELRQILKRNSRVHIVGTAHSFNNIADSTGVIVSLKNMDRICLKDPETVLVGPGVTYSGLRRALLRAGRAIENFPSLPHLSIIGSIVTGTHGGGQQLQIMAGLVEEYTLMDGNGKLFHLRRRDPLFWKLLVGLGYLGVVLGVRLRTVPPFDIQKGIYEHVDFQKFKSLGPSIFSMNEYTSLFIDLNEKEVSSVWVGKVVRSNLPQGTRAHKNFIPRLALDN